MLRTFNNQIFVEPLPKIEHELKVNKGFGTLAQKSTLVELKVLVGSTTYHAGLSVLVNAEIANHQWTSKLFTVDGKEGFFLPESYILMVRDENPQPITFSYDNVEYVRAPPYRGEF